MVQGRMTCSSHGCHLPYGLALAQSVLSYSKAGWTSHSHLPSDGPALPLAFLFAHIDIPAALGARLDLKKRDGTEDSPGPVSSKTHGEELVASLSPNQDLA